jgi:hypothetical protein
MLGNSSEAIQLAASQEGLSSMELLKFVISTETQQLPCQKQHIPD